tara:strand:- start:652 stop:1158 length:507 start_codon:yes stop_codon:yes gene_type:complete
MALNISDIYNNWYNQNNGDYSKLDQLLNILQVDRFGFYNLLEENEMGHNLYGIKRFYGDSFVIMELLTEGGGCEFIHNIYNGTYQFPGKTAQSLSEVLEYNNHEYVQYHPDSIHVNYKEFFFHAINRAVNQRHKIDKDFLNYFHPFSWEEKLNVTYDKDENKFYKNKK